MTREDDATYYGRRAETEVARAKQSSAPEVVRIHFMLASAYRARAAGSSQPKWISDV